MYYLHSRHANIWIPTDRTSINRRTFSFTSLTYLNAGDPVFIRNCGGVNYNNCEISAGPDHIVQQLAVFSVGNSGPILSVSTRGLVNPQIGLQVAA
jgi:hypothetical protein